MSGSSSLADYLAQNYLNADKPSSKKSKKKKRSKEPDDHTGGLIIDDDDSFDMRPSVSTKDEDSYLIVGDKTADFRKAQNNNWTIIGGLAPSSAKLDQEQALADKVLADATAERKAEMQKQDDDEAPVMLMQSGARAGLQTADDIAAQVEAKRKSQREAMEAVTKASGDLTHQTIYRDASGRIVDVALKKAEARRKVEEEVIRKKEETQALKGDVQLIEQKERKRELDQAKDMTFSRKEDDVEMNDMLKKKIRWDDPAAALVAKANVERRVAARETATASNSKKGRQDDDDREEGDLAMIDPAAVSASGKPVYIGAFEPNRYGIRPGSRWDGINRSNGFEKKYIDATNRRQDRAKLEYAWQLDE